MKSSVRRNILKAALSTPAVLTVRPASATGGGGAWSSAGLCKMADAEKARTNPPAGALTSASDGWMRTQVTLIRLKKKDGWISGEYFLDSSAGKYYQIMGSSVSQCPSSITSQITGYQSTTTKRYVLCYVDDGGKVLGYSSDCGGTPISGSCWTSLKSA